MEIKTTKEIQNFNPDEEKGTNLFQKYENYENKKWVAVDELDEKVKILKRHFCEDERYFEVEDDVPENYKGYCDNCHHCKLLNCLIK